MCTYIILKSILILYNLKTEKYVLFFFYLKYWDIRINHNFSLFLNNFRPITPFKSIMQSTDCKRNYVYIFCMLYIASLKHKI